MPLQTSGAISLLDVQNEFGGSNPISISEYYGAASGVPTSGAISLSNFYGKSAYTPMSLSYTGGVGEAYGGCQTVSASATVSVSGGIGPFTYVWTRTSGSTAPTSRSSGSTSSRTDSMTASQYLCANGEASSSYSVVVTDSTSATASITVSYNLINFGF